MGPWPHGRDPKHLVMGSRIDVSTHFWVRPQAEQADFHEVGTSELPVRGPQTAGEDATVK